MALAALAPSRASSVRIRPTETARCRLDSFTHRRNPRPQRGGGHLRGWRTITLASVRADATAGAPPRSFEPSTLSVRHFINLKNGVEAIPTLRAVGIDDLSLIHI